MATEPEFESWTSHGWGVKVDRPEVLFHLINSIAMLDKGRTYAWRGQSDAGWPLWPFLYRQLHHEGGEVTESLMVEAEQRILAEARRWGLGRDLGPSATDLHMLSVLQHHGVPTRFIDVTSNPMTALWFATAERRPDGNGRVPKTPGVLFAIDVTESQWYETFDHGQGQLRKEANGMFKPALNPLSDGMEVALNASRESGESFRVFPALPDDRMRAQEGFFVGSSVPKVHQAPGVLGFNPNGPAPGADKLNQLLKWDRGPGRPQKVPFCAIVIPEALKEKIRLPLKRTYNRRRRVLFPDVDGFREALERDQLD